MDNSQKKSLVLAVVGLIGMIFMGWILYPTPEASRKIADYIVAYNTTNPPNWFDIGVSAILGGMTVGFLFLALSLRETRRFESEVDTGDGGTPPTGSDGGTKKVVRLPMSRKVVEIGDWRKTPTDGMIHREARPCGTVPAM